MRTIFIFRPTTQQYTHNQQQVQRLYDVGIAGIHRLFASLDTVRQSHACVAVAGMDGALPTVVAGLVQAPVIAVPTSVGYGVGANGA